MLAWDRQFHAALYTAGMRPTIEPDGSILWQHPTTRGPTN